MAKNFSAEFADKLLDKLATDDEFRAHFEKNPHAALHKLGHETPEAERNVAGTDPVMCASVATLASKEQIQAARQELQAQLSSQIFSYAMSALQAS